MSAGILKEQTRSMEKLLPYRFEWFLPGHGRIHHGAAEECTIISNAA